MESVLVQLFNGLSIGSILLLAALGLAFSFGLMKVINMAHGEFIMVGAYVTYFFQQFIAVQIGGPDAPKQGVFFLLSIVAAFFITGLLGILLERFLIRHLYGRTTDTLLATWGVGLVLQQIARSYDSRNVPVVAPEWLNGSLAIAPGLEFPYKRLFIIGLVIICIISIYFYLYYSPAGRRTRATMQNREMAASLGVTTRRGLHGRGARWRRQPTRNRPRRYPHRHL